MNMNGNSKTVETSHKIIYTRRIAMRLMELGNIPAGVTPNPSKPAFMCWIFPITPKFEKDLTAVLGEEKPQRPEKVKRENSEDGVRVTAVPRVSENLLNEINAR